MAPSKYPLISKFLKYLIIPVCFVFLFVLVKSDNTSVLNFFLELKYAILNINMESKIIKDKGTLFRCTLLTVSL